MLSLFSPKSILGAVKSALSIYPATTPLPGFYRFDLDEPVLPLLDDGSMPQFREISPKLAAKRSPFLNEVFTEFPDIRTALVGPASFIVQMKPELWEELKEPVATKIEELHTAGVPIEKGFAIPTENEMRQRLAVLGDDASVSDRVRLVLDDVVRPALMEDGGDCNFLGFVPGGGDNPEQGYVQIELMGACKGCPSSTQTLRGFVERVLAAFVPEVIGVQRVEDDEE